MAAPAWIPHSAPLGLPLAPLLAEPFQPLVLGVLLAVGVGLSLPCGALVVLAQAIGLTINWHLCRGVLRPRLQCWLAASQWGRRLERRCCCWPVG